jgi:hypothetical protein
MMRLIPSNIFFVFVFIITAAMVSCTTTPTPITTVVKANPSDALTARAITIDMPVQVVRIGSRGVTIRFSQAMNRETLEASTSLYKGNMTDHVDITAEASKLKLESNCAGEWIVRNDNSQAQAFTWKLSVVEVTSSGIVAGKSQAIIKAGGLEPSGRQLRLFVKGVLQETALTGVNQCQPRNRFAWSSDSKQVTIRDLNWTTGLWTLAISTSAQTQGDASVNLEPERLSEAFVQGFEVDVEHEIKDLKDFKALGGIAFVIRSGRWVGCCVWLGMRCGWRHEWCVGHGWSGAQIQ